MKKYRISKKTYNDRRCVFVPETRFCFFWWSSFVQSDIPIFAAHGLGKDVQFSTYGAAANFIEMRVKPKVLQNEIVGYED